MGELIANQKHDPGGKVRVAVNPNWHCDALFSPCERFRFRLSRIWNTLAKPPRLVFYLWMNPSTGTKKINDPTIIRGCNLAQFWGYDGALIGNSHPYCSTDNTNLIDIPDEVMQENLQHLLEMAKASEIAIAAFGHLGAKYQWMADRAVEHLRSNGITLYHLGLSNDGVPRHLLSRGKSFVAKDAQPILWETQA